MMEVLRKLTDDLVLLRFETGEGAIAFTHQIADDNQSIRLECQLEPGFAHIDSDGEIWRNGRVVGRATGKDWIAVTIDGVCR
jgi:hypothetical protein